MNHKPKNIPNKKSRRDFTQSAGAHPRNNTATNPMRGGIRL